MPNVPDPNYDYAIERLVDAYKAAVGDILVELRGLDVTDSSRANSAAALAEVARILTQLNDESARWCEEFIPQAARDGVIRAIVSLGGGITVAEAETIAKFNRMNANMAAAAVADTQADLLAVTQNVDRKVRAAVRNVVGQSMRANMAAGINGRRTIARDVLDGMRRTLGDVVSSGIIDARGRRWRPEVYADMITRTKLMLTHMEATANEAIARGALFGVISRHNATDACAKYEGKIVKLTPEADGDYPYVGDLRASGAIFHPNCKHVVSPIRDPRKYEGGTI
ncbi:phage minor capsid protein [Paenibacillus sp. SI8]|uniref:phage minor capsid protein n=1 Tax=unclassified Paenibacillus TaxID=185978 RepID=UPI003465AAA4